VFVVEAVFLDRARAALAQAGRVEHLVVLDAAADGALTLTDLEQAESGDDFDFDATWRSVSPEDILTLIYTSGTTGPPKGVQLTHANELAQCRGIDAVGHPRPGGSVVSYLPAAHIADRGLSHYAHMVWGHTVTCCPEVTQVFAHVADCHPTFWGAVPRVWEKLKAALEAGIASEPDERRRVGIQQAIEQGLSKVRLEQ
jgi:long-chain acyl-CoA synthetase